MQGVVLPAVTAFFVTIATTLGTGILALPCKLSASGLGPAVIVLSLVIVMQVAVVAAYFELHGRTRLRGEAITLPLLARLYLPKRSALLFTAAAGLHLLTILISYALAGSLSLAQLLGITASSEALIAPFIILLATFTIAAGKRVLAFTGIMTGIKLLLILAMVSVVGIAAAAAPLSPVSAYARILQPFLISTVALGGVVNLLPVMLADASPTPRTYRALFGAVVAGLMVCYAINVAWASFVLLLVPQSRAAAAALGIPTSISLEAAAAEGQPATVPLVALIQLRFPAYSWISTAVSSFTSLSVSVSFIIMSAGLLNIVNGVLAQRHQHRQQEDDEGHKSGDEKVAADGDEAEGRALMAAAMDREVVPESASASSSGVASGAASIRKTSTSRGSSPSGSSVVPALPSASSVGTASLSFPSTPPSSSQSATAAAAAAAAAASPPPTPLPGTEDTASLLLNNEAKAVEVSAASVAASLHLLEARILQYLLPEPQAEAVAVSRGSRVSQAGRGADEEEHISLAGAPEEELITERAPQPGSVLAHIAVCRALLARADVTASVTSRLAVTGVRTALYAVAVPVVLGYSKVRHSVGGCCSRLTRGYTCTCPILSRLGSSGPAAPPQQGQLPRSRFAWYAAAFFTVYITAQLDPKSFLSALELFTSLALNLSCGYLVGRMYQQSRARAAVAAAPLPLPQEQDSSSDAATAAGVGFSLTAAAEAEAEAKQSPMPVASSLGEGAAHDAATVTVKALDATSASPSLLPFELPATVAWLIPQFVQLSFGAAIALDLFEIAAGSSALGPAAAFWIALGLMHNAVMNLRAAALIRGLADAPRRVEAAQLTRWLRWCSICSAACCAVAGADPLAPQHAAPMLLGLLSAQLSVTAAAWRLESRRTVSRLALTPLTPLLPVACAALLLLLGQSFALQAAVSTHSWAAVTFAAALLVCSLTASVLAGGAAVLVGSAQ